MARRRAPTQSSFTFRCWGGARAGAGRPRKAASGPAHRTRAAQPASAPAPVEARTWLLRVGWRRCGLVGVDEVPAAGLGEP
jgi:hypothetical protein